MANGGDRYTPVVAKSCPWCCEPLGRAKQTECPHCGRDLYDDDQVGSILSTEYCALKRDMTVTEAINEIRRQEPSRETIYYLYVVDADNRLLGVVSLMLGGCKANVGVGMSVGVPVGSHGHMRIGAHTWL